MNEGRGPLRTSLLGLTLVGVAGFGAACGGAAAKPSAPLDCAYLESDGNCWRTVSNAALSCLPGSSEIGTLSTDRSTCTFPSGDVVTFTPPPPLPGTTAGLVPWNFTVTTSSGAGCLSFNERTDGTMTITVQGDTVTVTPTGGKGLALTCPGGTTYTNPLGLVSCPDASLYSLLPAANWSLSSSIVYFALTGASGTDTEEALFTCEMASP